MVQVNVFISCGAERDPFRNLANRVIDNLTQFLVTERDGPLLFCWDYRRDLPRNVAAGELERRSLEQVDKSRILVGVLGETVPGLTRKEILRAYEREAQGLAMEPYVLADPRKVGDDHQKLLRKIKRDYGRDVQYGHYTSRERFLDQMYRTLFRFLLEYDPPSSPPGPAI